jgi:hypothetical protein
MLRYAAYEVSSTSNLGFAAALYQEGGHVFMAIVAAATAADAKHEPIVNVEKA